MDKDIKFPEVENLEAKLLLEAVYLHYGYDFRDFSMEHIRRRLDYHLKQYSYSNIPMVMHDILMDPDAFQQLLKSFSINVTAMFRDPQFYRKLQSEVYPVLKTWPYIKLWHAGCASGEEVYSNLILMHEAGIMNKTQVYATDFNEKVLEAAREGFYKLDRIQEFTRNYKEARGKKSLSEYYEAAYDHIRILPRLRKKIVFAGHNLATDSSFGEMHLILCRNVLIYFNQKLQDKALKLFYESLVPGGFLCLGRRESITGLQYAHYFDPVDKENRIFRKKYPK